VTTREERSNLGARVTGRDSSEKFKKFVRGIEDEETLVTPVWRVFMDDDLSTPSTMK
jgi:hypothetical protein